MLTLSTITIGLSLYTAHFNNADAVRNDTPGVYVSADSYTLGYVRNSLGRPAFYATKTWPIADTGLDVSVGAITGYRIERVHTGACGDGPTERRVNVIGNRCWHERGTTHAKFGVRPLVGVSYAFRNLFHDPLPTPRLTLLGKGLHLSIEKEFK